MASAPALPSADVKSLMPNEQRKLELPMAVNQSLLPQPDSPLAAQPFLGKQLPSSGKGEAVLWSQHPSFDRRQWWICCRCCWKGPCTCVSSPRPSWEALLPLPTPAYGVWQHLYWAPLFPLTQTFGLEQLGRCSSLVCVSQEVNLSGRKAFSGLKTWGSTSFSTS